jgi:hypothetical protein
MCADVLTLLCWQAGRHSKVQLLAIALGVVVRHHAPQHLRQAALGLLQQQRQQGKAAAQCSSQQCVLFNSAVQPL